MNKRSIYDCFLFNGELELLELRLNILEELDCHFVIMEAGETYRNKPKPFYYEENKERYKKWQSRIIYIKLPHLGFSPPLRNEYFSRNMFYEVAKDTEDDDYLILSDLDEVPCPIRTKKYIDKDLGEPFCFFHSNFLYKLNLFNVDAPFSYGSLVFQRKFLVDYDKVNNRDILANTGLGFQRLRELRGYFIRIPGGWHYSYCFSEEEIRRKLSTFGHPELDGPEMDNQEKILERINNRRALFSDDRLEAAGLNSSNCPDYLLKNLGKYSHLLAL